MIPKIMPLTKFRSQVLKTVQKAQNNGDEYVITNKGEPAAVLMSFEEWESLLETLEIKRDKQLIKQINKGRKYFKSGKKGKVHTDLDWN